MAIMGNIIASVRHRWPFLLAGLLVLVVGSLAGASKLEENDDFCTSCHLAPELVYHERSRTAPTVDDPFELADLASFHYWDDATFRCIDCHRGDDSLIHRGRVLALAAGDTFTWAAGRADEAVSKGTVANVNPNLSEWLGPDQFNRAPDILNAGCLKCHQAALTLVGFENHFHNKLPAAQLAYQESGELHYPANWSAAVPTDQLLQAEETILTCLDCHRAHVDGFESEYFLDERAIVLPACVQCHLEAEAGPLDLIRN